jgi:phosphate transport system permease protein
MQANELAKIRSIIGSNKRFDLMFAIAGFLALMVGCDAGLCGPASAKCWCNGGARLNPDFFTSFPSRRAENAGILSAPWVGSVLVMLVTALSAIPLGVAAGRLSGGIRPKNWVTEIIEINVTNLAGVPSIVYGLLALGVFVYTLRLRPEHPHGRPDARPADPAGGHRGHARGDARDPVQHPRRAPTAVGATQWQVVSDHLVPYATPAS